MHHIRAYLDQTGETGALTLARRPTPFDNSPPDGSPGVMLGFIEGHHARVWAQRSAADRRAAVLGNFATYFGPQALHPRDYVEQNWADDVWTRGCYVGFTPPGVLLDYGPAIRAPVMDGAARSGERAAAEALAAL
jgi:monoamine oxidase